MKKIVITGGSGFIGRRLTDYFLNKGYQIAHISYSGKQYKNVLSFKWNPKEKKIEEAGKKLLREAEAVIHLSGASIFGILTESYKEELISSRVDSTNFLCDILNDNKIEKRTEVVIFASAIGYYGVGGDIIINENSPPGKGFFSDLCIQWENASLGLHPSIRNVHIRIGFVMDKEEGGFPKIALPIKFFAGMIPGSGKQYLSWIHIMDLVRIFEFVLENNNAKGVYNGVSPNPVTFSEFYKAVAKKLKRPIILPNVPEFILKPIMGDLFDVLIGGSRVVPQKLLQEGFVFQFDTLDNSLNNII